jgi:hypothetical protein
MSAMVIPDFIPRSRTTCGVSRAASRSFSSYQIGPTMSATGRDEALGAGLYGESRGEPEHK